MTRGQYIVALIMLYTAFAGFVLIVVALVASVTVVPMFQNYRDHGSIFLETRP